MLVQPMIAGYSTFKEMDPTESGGIKIVTAFATNALATATIPAIPAGFNFIQILALFALYATAAATGTLTVGGQTFTVLDAADKPVFLNQYLGLYSAPPTITLAAGGAGNIGVISVAYRNVG